MLAISSPWQCAERLRDEEPVRLKDSRAQNADVSSESKFALAPLVVGAATETALLT